MKHQHTCDAMVITCIDFRIQRAIDAWLAAHIKDYRYDRVSVAGGVYDVYAMLKQVEISARLHHIKNVILMNHEDCGAYGEAGTLTRHKEDLMKAKKAIKELHPRLDVEAYYVRLNGEILSVA